MEKIDRLNIFRLFNHNPAMIAVLSYNNKRVIYLNLQFLEKTGYTPKEVLSKTPEELSLIFNKGKPYNPVKALNDKIRLHKVEIDLLCKDKSKLSGFCTSELIELDGDIFYLISILDVTEQTLLAHKIKEKEQILSRLPPLNRRTINQVPVHDVFKDFIGDSSVIGNLFIKLEKFMHREINLLLRGESGCGKDLLAKAIHNGSGRSSGPFVIVNCSAISKELAESLLFGHKKGAFTGALSDSRGFFAQADGGTLFLDEIGDMPYEIQPKILRVLEDKKIKPVGETYEKTVNFRLIAATNQNMEELILAGKFRQDLFFRLNESPVFIPPLRERKKDIPMLCAAFLKKFTELFELGDRQINSAVMKKLEEYQWPGNVRELKSVIERLVLMSNQTEIGMGDLHLIETFSQEHEVAEQVAEADGSFASIEKNTILQAYYANDKNLEKTSKALKIGRTTVYRKLKTYGIL